ncbi:MAG: spore maturation protein [Clostridiales bacterium]|jgi:spore maturation protein B|nr:spore maturation protein [Clostridiales bacterium]
MFVIILGYAAIKKVNMYDNFVEGATEGFSTILRIMPTLIGLMVAVGTLRASGALELFVGLISPFMKAIGFPEEAVPLSLMRLISSSAATGLLLDIFKTHGPDSFLGRFVSVMMSCTETVFYTMSVYFLSVKITKTRYTLAGALFANFAGIIASLLITRSIF